MNLTAAAFAVFVAAAPASAQDAERWDARLAAVSGDVVVHSGDGREAASGAEDMPLDQGDRVTTGAGASADISLDGGSLIHLGEDSDFAIEKTEKSESSFSLALGSLFAKIEKLGSRRLSVRTPTVVCAVRGTEFGVEAAADEQTHVGVFDEGLVEVSNGAGVETLAPNQETSVAKDRAPLKPFALKRFAPWRPFMKDHRRRLAALRKRWKAMPSGQRRERRRRILEKARGRQDRSANPRRQGPDGKPGERGPRGGRGKPRRPGRP